MRFPFSAFGALGSEHAATGVQRTVSELAPDGEMELTVL